jgi:hypothetical protein
MNHNFMKNLHEMNRTKVLVTLAVVLVVALGCGAMVMMGGNLAGMIRAHLGM